EAPAIFGQIERIIRCTDNFDAVLVQLLSEFQSCLPTELNDNPFRLLVKNEIIKMLPEYGLEVQFIGDIKVCRDGFRIAVDHDSLVATLARCEHTVYTRVIKLNTLSNPVRSRTEYNYLL